MKSLNEKQREFLGNPFVGVVTTLRADGSPHNTVVWVDTDGGDVTFNTEYGRCKVDNLQRDPRVALTVVDPADAYHWLSVSGTAELIDEGAAAHIDRLAKKYIDKDVYPWHSAEHARVTVRITAEKLHDNTVS